MNATLLNPRADQDDPFEEAWFIEASLDAERAVWLRYSVSRASGTAITKVHAMVLRGSEQWAHTEDRPWTPLSGDLIHPQGLSATAAKGAVGDIQWDLALTATQAHHHVPRRLAKMGLTGREYASAALDLVVSGSISVAGETWEVRDAKGVLGHIWGRRANTRQWLWCHASHIEGHPDTQVEVLCARLGLGPLTLPWATSIVVNGPMGRWSLTQTRTLFLPRVQASTDRWSLQVHRSGVNVRLSATMPHPSSVFTVGLKHVNGRESQVQNSPLGTLRLDVDHPEWGRLALHSDRANVEIATSA